MSIRDIGAEMLAVINVIKDYKKGKVFLQNNELTEPSAQRVIRSKLKMSQLMFAGLLGVGMRTLQDWQQGSRNQQGPVVALLRIADLY